MGKASGSTVGEETGMIRYKVSPNAWILFVGINPHPGSFRRGVPFSNNKMFWYLLNRAGVRREKEEDLRDDRMLNDIYNRKFGPAYGLGFVNVVNRPTRDVSQLGKGEEKAGRRRIVGIIRQYRPVVVCFIGRVTYERFSGSKDFRFGWQPDISGSRVYVMHFPIRGEAKVRIRELKTVAGEQNSG